MISRQVQSSPTYVLAPAAVVLAGHSGSLWQAADALRNRVSWQHYFLWQAAEVLRNSVVGVSVLRRTGPVEGVAWHVQQLADLVDELCE